MRSSRLVPLLLLCLTGCNFDQELRDCIAEQICVDESLSVTLHSTANAQPLGSRHLPPAQHRRPVIAWQELPDAVYQVQASLCPTGALSDCAFNDVGSGVVATQFELPIPGVDGLPYVGRYVYRVRACKTNGLQACGRWTPPRYFQAGDPSGPFPGDMTGDGRAEVVVGDPSAHLGAGGLIVFRRDGSDFLADEASVSALSPSAGLGTSVAHAGDVNADGYGDVVVAGAVGTTAYLLLGDGALTPVALPAQGAGFPGSVAAGGDFNGDGYADALVSRLDGLDTRVFVYPGGPDGLEPAPAFTLVPSTDGVFGKAMTALDLNQDGFSEVIVSSAAGRGEVYVFFGRALEGLIGAGITWTDPTDSDFGVGVAGAGDLNGDGYPDALIHASGGTIHVAFGNGTVNAPVRSATPGTVHGAAGGYLDGDGFADLLFFGSSDFAFHPGSGAGLQGPVREGFQSATQHSFAVAGDVDGDGAEDVAVGVMVNSQPRVQVWFSPDQSTETILPPASGTSTFGRSVGSIR